MIIKKSCWSFRRLSWTLWTRPTMPPNCRQASGGMPLTAAKLPWGLAVPALEGPLKGLR